MSPERKTSRGSRPGRRRGVPQAARPSRRSPPGATARRRGMIVVIVVAVAAVSLLAMSRGWFGARGPRSGPANAAELKPAEAFMNARRLELAEQHNASLPFYRRALEGPDMQDWRLRREYAVALNNAAVEVRRGRIGDVFATRSNADRIQLARESLRQVELALAGTNDPAARALLFEDRGETYEWWGFSWNALRQYDTAYRLDSRSPKLLKRAMRCAELMLADTTARR